MSTVPPPKLQSSKRCPERSTESTICIARANSVRQLFRRL
jgi:hypothetical protein